MHAMLSLSRFEILRTLRNKQFTFFSLIMPILFYFIFLKVDGANAQIGGTTWNTYFLMSMAAFSVVGTALFGIASRTSYERTQGWLRLVQTTPMSNASYMVSKIASQVLICALSVCILFLIGGISQGISLTFGQWIACLFWLSLGVLPFMSLGLLIGILGNVNASSSISNIINLVLAMLGGLWFPISIMPQWMQDIGHWTPTYRFADIAWNIVAGKIPAIDDLAILAGYLVVFIVTTAIILRRQEASNL